MCPDRGRPVEPTDAPAPPDGWGPRAGVAWPLAFLATAAGGGLASATFEWPTDPFSVVGTTGDATAAAFNAGLVATGLLVVAFATWLWRRRGRAVGAVAALVAVALAGAGAVPAGRPAHAVFGTGLLVGCWLWPWTAAVVDWRRDRRRDAAVAALLGTAAVAVWLPYDLGIASAQVGYAVAELVTVGSAGAWSVRTVRRRATDRSVLATEGDATD